MRFVGLTLCLLASSFGARADSVEDRVAALEARVKALEQALREGGAKAAVPAASPGLEGTYKGSAPNGQVISLELKAGRAVATLGTDTKTGTYEATGQRIVITIDGKPEPFEIDGDHLRATKGTDKIDFVKSS
jgi:hypothetical protein